MRWEAQVQESDLWCYRKLILVFICKWNKLLFVLYWEFLWFTIKRFPTIFQSSFNGLDFAAATETLLIHNPTEDFICEVRQQSWEKVKHRDEIFVFTSRTKTVHFASFLISDSCFSAAQIAKTLLLAALTAASLDNQLILHMRCNHRHFVFAVIWCIARQPDPNGQTA